MMLQKLSNSERRAVEAHRRAMSERLGEEIDIAQARADWERNHATHWREERMKEFLRKQREEILRHKWIESEKAHRDLGSEAVMDWISKYAANWRTWYESENDGTDS